MSKLDDALKLLTEERSRIDEERLQIYAAIAALERLTTSEPIAGENLTEPTKTVSPEVRERASNAKREWWAGKNAKPVESNESSFT
jgi:hypothetical protein